jgi:phosphohistidine phosphatase
MLQLSLIRHAKSSWQDAGLRDFDRPLNARGLRDAPMMGKRVADHGITFDQVITSPALRALSTARLIAAQLDYPETAIQPLQQLYDASVGNLLQCVQSLDSQHHRIALVAHNPGLTGLCNFLSGEAIVNLPTCAVAVIEFPLDDWQAVYRESGNLKMLLTPKQHAL